MISMDSRNALAPIIEVQDTTGRVLVPARVDIRPTLDASKLTDLRQVQYTQGDSWGNIAHEFFGDARHWWVIAELSGVLDPFTELEVGRLLTVTTPESLQLDILTGGAF